MLAQPGTTFIILGAVVLCVTGAEALYADLGHFGKKPIRIAWFSVVMPSLIHLPKTADWQHALSTCRGAILDRSDHLALSASTGALALGQLPAVHEHASGADQGEVRGPGCSRARLKSPVSPSTLVSGSNARWCLSRQALRQLLEHDESIRAAVAGEVRAESQAVDFGGKVLADPLGLIPICVPCLCKPRTLPQIETPTHVLPE